MTARGSLKEEYATALVRHIAKADERALHRAYELGRKALGGGLGVLDLVTLHDEAVGQFVDRSAHPDARMEFDRAAEFLTESLSAFEMSLRGYREANSGLAALNSTLQQLYELAGGLNRCRTEAEIMSFSIDQMMRIPGVKRAWIDLHTVEGAKVIDPDHTTIRPSAGDSAPSDPTSPRPCGFSTNSDSQLSEHTADNGTKYTCVPLTIEGKIAGALNLCRSVALLEEQRRTFVSIADQISNALERARLYEILELKVEERTRELVKASKVKDEFLAIVSHELRTPLTSINSVIALLDAEKLGSIPPSVRKFVKLARRNCERLIAIVNDLLDLTRISRGTFEVNLQQVELMPILVHAIESRRVNPESRNIELAIADNAKKVWIEADPPRLQQVIDNLLTNAIKFSDPNYQIEVNVDCHTDFVRVSIADHGVGIPKEFQDHVFEAFTQADSSSTRNRGGVGLGLNVARAIVEAHHGKIGFASVEGKGTTFYFDLPVALK